MAHLKKDFPFHKVFDNKYAEQSYIAYLSKNKRKYVMNSQDFVERYIVITIDFIFRVNKNRFLSFLILCKKWSKKDIVSLSDFCKN